jgi:hypothetical protein
MKKVYKIKEDLSDFYMKLCNRSMTYFDKLIKTVFFYNYKR